MSHRSPTSVALVSAQSQPGQDAIGDYTRHLVAGLNARAFTATHIEHDDWSLRGLRQLLRALDRLQPDVVHLQHPQSVYGRALTPQLLSILRPGVVTLHEASRYGPLRGRARLLPLLVRPRRVVVTSEFERDYVVGFAPWARARLAVIPLASNIPMRVRPERPPLRTVVYFGSIRPDKGLERFLAMARRLATIEPTVECVVIGSPVRASTAYAASLQRGAPVRWLTALSADRVAEELSHASVAYLPFPDGASERRGSLLAALGCGLPTVTTAGPHTTASIRDAVCVPANIDDAELALTQLLTDEARRVEMSRRARQYAEARTWESVVEAHARLYAPLLRNRQPWL